MSRTVLALALAGVIAAAPVTALAATANTTVAEITLKKTIADIQAGKPDYDRMVPELVEGMKAQPGVQQQLAALGPAKAFTRVGDSENPWIWDVTFESGMVLTWTISINDDGVISGLFVKPKT
jgi:hypothetical protein